MEEEIEYEEEEEYMTIYRKTKRTNGKSKQKPKSGTKSVVKSTSKLNPFLHGVGVRPRACPTPDIDEPHLNQNYVHHLVKNTLTELECLATKPSVSNKDRGNRLFLGECDFEDEDEREDGEEKVKGHAEEEEIQETEDIFARKSVWRFRKTGRKAYDRFRRLVEFIIIAKQLFTVRWPVRLNRRDSILFFMDTQRRDSWEQTGAPLFDVNAFKSLGQKNMTSSLKSCLDLPSADRTDSQINQMVHMMRGFTKFSGYPQTVQSGICKRGWYARFESTTVIVREGNRAEFFYMILSGVAVSSNTLIVESDGKEDRVKDTPILLRAGDTIGEKEILTDKERPATIVCRDPVEVLGVDRDVLLDVFKAAGGQASIRYLRTIPELSLFPLELLQTSHFSMSVHYYGRGAVIVKNSNDSEWVYAIRSGSCNVFKSVRESQKPGCEQRVASSRNGLTLPSISRTQSLLKSASTEDIDEMTQKKNKNKKLPVLERSQTTLPSLSPGKPSLLSTTIQPLERIKTPNISKLRKNNINPSQTSPRRSSMSDNANPTPDRLGRLQKRHFGSSESLTQLDGGGTMFYVRLGVLSERSCFGLHPLLYDHMPNVTLVSNGAECVLLSRQFLKENMNATLMHKLQMKIPPYPTKSQLQDALDEKMMWENYREKVMSDILK